MFWFTSEYVIDIVFVIYVFTHFMLNMIGIVMFFTFGWFVYKNYNQLRFIKSLLPSFSPSATSSASVSSSSSAAAVDNVNNSNMNDFGVGRLIKSFVLGGFTNQKVDPKLWSFLEKDDSNTIGTIINSSNSNNEASHRLLDELAAVNLSKGNNDDDGGDDDLTKTTTTTTKRNSDNCSNDEEEKKTKTAADNKNDDENPFDSLIGSVLQKLAGNPDLISQRVKQNLKNTISQQQTLLTGPRRVRQRK